HPDRLLIRVGCDVEDILKMMMSHQSEEVRELGAEGNALERLFEHVAESPCRVASDGTRVECVRTHRALREISLIVGRRRVLQRGIEQIVSGVPEYARSVAQNVCREGPDRDCI